MFLLFSLLGFLLEVVSADLVLPFLAFHATLI